MTIPVPESPTYSLDCAKRLPAVICTVPLPAPLPSERTSQVSPGWVTTAVPPLTIIAVSALDGSAPPQFDAIDQSPDDTCHKGFAPGALETAKNAMDAINTTTHRA